MRKPYVRLLLLLFSICIVFSLSACSNTESSDHADYTSAESFESALNNGDNVIGKTVKFHADSLHPESLYGYNIWAGEHLNFISSEDPGIKRGETVVVTVTDTSQLDNDSWLIYYDFPDSENSSSKTNSINSSSSSTSSSSQKSETQNLQILETGLYVTSSYVWDDTVYINYIGLIHNPNEEVALFPKLIATAKNPDGTILATDEQSASVIMPGDTLPIIGTFSIISSELEDGSYVNYQVECQSFQNDTFIYSSARTTDFTIFNISEHSGSKSYVTGEIKSTFSEDISMLKVVAIFRKDNEIVGSEYSYIDSLSAYQSKAFELDSLTGFPEHDSVEIYAVPTL